MGGDSDAHEAVLRTWLDSGIWIADKPVREALRAVLDENARMRESLDAILLIVSVLEGMPRHNIAENAARVAGLLAKGIKVHADNATPQQPARDTADEGAE